MDDGVRSLPYGYFSLLGADPGLILGCCKILPKKIEHRNDVICRNIIDSARNKKVKF